MRQSVCNDGDLGIRTWLEARVREDGIEAWGAECGLRSVWQVRDLRRGCAKRGGAKESCDAMAPPVGGWWSRRIGRGRRCDLREEAVRFGRGSKIVGDGFGIFF